MSCLAGTAIGPDTSGTAGEVVLSPPLGGPEVTAVDSGLSTNVGNGRVPGTNASALAGARRGSRASDDGGCGCVRRRRSRGRAGSGGGGRWWWWVGAGALAHVVADVVPLGVGVAGRHDCQDQDCTAENAIDSLKVIQSLVKLTVHVEGGADKRVGGTGLVGGELSKPSVSGGEMQERGFVRTSQNMVPPRPLLTTY